MKNSNLFQVLALFSIVLILTGGTAFGADTKADYEALEEAGAEAVSIQPGTASENLPGGSIPMIDSIPQDGALLIPESTNDNVGMYDPYDGTFLGNLINGTGIFSTPINAIQGPDGNVYVSDQVADAVFVYDTTGTYLYTYADGSDGLNNVRGIDFKGDHLFVTSGDDYVAEFDGPHSRLADFINDGSDPFDIMFLEDGRALLCNIQGTTDDVRLYDVNGNFLNSVISTDFPEQVQFDDALPGEFLAGAFTSDVITDFELNGTIHQTTPLNSCRGVYRLGNGNILATNSSGVFELDPGTGNIIEQQNTGSARFIELYLPAVTGEPGVLMGTVTDLQLNPIEGAIVAVGYRRDTTDVTGSYSFSLYPNTYTATATANYHNTVTIENIVIAENDTTVVDFALPTPAITVDTSPIIMGVDTGQVVTVQRNVANSGDGELEFDIDLVLGGVLLSVGSGSGTHEIVANNVDPKGAADVTPFSLNSNQLPVTNDFQDSVFALDLDFLGDTQLLGIEFDGTYFWITGGNSGTDPNILYKLDADGNFVEQFNQNGTTSWGWRDLAFDGTYLYGSDDGTIDQIDPTTGNTTGVIINGPATVNRALAYDPGADLFYTANFSTSIYEFSRDGNVSNSWSNSKAVYGMAWDDITDGGPFLWVFSQDGNPQIEISQFDPLSGTYTGLSWQCDLPTGFTDGLAGGACVTTDWDPSIAALFLLVQGTPNDFMYGYELAPFSRWLIVDPMSGTLQPGENVNLDITIDFTGDMIVPDSIYEATIVVNNNTATTPEIDVEITSTTDIDEIVGLPTDYSLAQNYPNPFNAQTSIAFTLPRQSEVTIEIYNVLGQKATTLAEGLMPAGNHSVTWDASDVASGVYYYKLSAGDYTSIKMMTLLK